MRRFLVFAGNCRNIDVIQHVVEMPDLATDDECKEACEAALDVLVFEGDPDWTDWTETLPDGAEA